MSPLFAVGGGDIVKEIQIYLSTRNLTFMGGVAFIVC